MRMFFRVEVVDELVCEEFIRISNKDTLEAVIIEGGELDEFEDEEFVEMVHQLESAESLSSTIRWKEELTRDTDVSDKSEKVELKALPSTLKYAYLDEGQEKPVILSSSLSPLEEEKVLRVLRDNRAALGWTISDIKGISPAIF